MGVREDKKRETRARLERAALDLFTQRGYERTTVEQVASAAGVSARTAFRYFPTKADLVFADAESDLAALRTHLSRQDRALPALEAVRLALLEFSERIGSPLNAERGRVIETNPTLTARGLEVRDVWAEAVGEELAARRGRRTPDERDRLGGMLVVAILVSAFREWSLAEDRRQSLGAAIERSASWAVEMLQP
jgi:AcrR family transcriptional regulator